ncbi:hypothetical protein [Lysobacter sp.]|uniref:hypothetical protein n=1 Tax=Lysobacter sp. TaxID=72226 RepID=UPI002D5B3EB9|nr:hypothetical protein [Lysobacter sp.]HZX75783.1 hypothetical protein [Lysobacter sp.]
MNLPMEVLLVAGVYALYLQDSALLLHYDEVVLTHGRRWTASVGGPLEFRGRRLHLPDPWTPTRAIFRASWLGEPTGGRRTQRPHFLAALRAVHPGCRALWALMLVGLPLLLWAFPHPLALLALAVSIYAVTLGLAIQVWRYRRAFELSGRDALSMGFELLCCPPHAINVVRRLSLRRGLGEDAMHVVRRSLDDDDAREACRQIRERLSYAFDFHGERPDLVAARQRLEEQA